MEIENSNQKIDTEKELNGIFVKGIVISSTAKAFDRKDGSGKTVLTKHEIALRPGIAVWESFLDPKEHRELELEGNEVVRFPHVEDFEPINLRVHRFSEANGVMQIKKAEWIA